MYFITYRQRAVDNDHGKLSRDPREIFKIGGIAKLGIKTAKFFKNFVMNHCARRDPGAMQNRPGTRRPETIAKTFVTLCLRLRWKDEGRLACKFTSTAQCFQASRHNRVVIMYDANPVATRLLQAVIPVSRHPLVLLMTDQADPTYFAYFFKCSIG